MTIKLSKGKNFETDLIFEDIKVGECFINRHMELCLKDSNRGYYSIADQNGEFNISYRVTNFDQPVLRNLGTKRVDWE